MTMKKLKSSRVSFILIVMFAVLPSKDLIPSIGTMYTEILSTYVQVIKTSF